MTVDDATRRPRIFSRACPFYFRRRFFLTIRKLCATNVFHMMEQLDPGEAPPADGGGGGATILAKRPLTFSYMSPVLGQVAADMHAKGRERKAITQVNGQHGTLKKRVPTASSEEWFRVISAGFLPLGVRGGLLRDKPRIPQEKATTYPPPPLESCCYRCNHYDTNTNGPTTTHRPLSDICVSWSPP